jgi:hypothetical protein
MTNYELVRNKVIEAVPETITERLVRKDIEELDNNAKQLKQIKVDFLAEILK